MDPSKKYTDLLYLNSISKGNKDFTIKFLNTFIHQMDIDLPVLKLQLDTEDWEGLANTAHKIKPSFLFVGVKELEASAKEIENNTRNHLNLEKLPALVSNLMYICEAVIVELQQEIKLLSS